MIILSNISFTHSRQSVRWIGIGELSVERASSRHSAPEIVSSFFLIQAKEIHDKDRGVRRNDKLMSVVAPLYRRFLPSLCSPCIFLDFVLADFSLLTI